MRVLALVNPNASRAELILPELTAWFAERPESKLLATSSDRELRAAIAEHGAEADRIMIGGGDGTISAALPELLAANKPMAVLPLGTANDFARTIGLTDVTRDALETAFSGRIHKIDIGVVNDHPFLNVASVGVASAVSRAQSKDRKQSFRALSYAVSFREAIRYAHPFYAEIVADGHHYWNGMVHQVSVGNGRFHGGGLVVAENAAIDDGQLSLYVVKPGSFLQLLACVATLRFGFGGELEALKRATAQEVMLRTQKPASVNVDGDIRTKTPAKFSLLRQALSVVIPDLLPANHRGLSET